MTIGDQTDVLNRLVAVLPNWFDGNGNPTLDGLLALYAYAGSFNYSQLFYVQEQTRITTATDINLDNIAVDFFGINGYPRGNGESDNAYRARILAVILHEGATRTAMYDILLALTGRAPQIFEPQRAADSGGYSVGGCGYNTFGQWSNADCAYQCFIICYNPIIPLVSSVAGYGIPQGAYSTGSQAAYLAPSGLTYVISQAQIYEQINQTKMEGTIAWVRFSN
jgi:hypothetical protein